MPGNTMIHMGRNLRYPARRQPPLAWDMSLAANALCTITYVPNSIPKSTC